MLQDLDALVDPTTRGDPQSALRWTCKSTTRLAQELNRLGHQVSQRTVCDLLRQLHYRLQSVRKTREGTQHADRDAQFHHTARMVTQYQRDRQPVISLDTKKKELIGDFKNGGGSRWVVRRVGTDRTGLSLPAGHQQVEQDRAPHVLPHHNNWRGRPLLIRQIVVNLIGSVTTQAGLRIRAELDVNTYEGGLKVSGEQLADVTIERDEFHGEWNYRIKPHRARREL